MGNIENETKTSILEYTPAQNGAILSQERVAKIGEVLDCSSNGAEKSTIAEKARWVLEHRLFKLRLVDYNQRMKGIKGNAGLVFNALDSETISLMGISTIIVDTSLRRVQFLLSDNDRTQTLTVDNKGEHALE